VKANDRGGLPAAGPVDRSEHALADWELLIDSLSIVLNKKGLRSSHESRRAQEELPRELYESLAYYERWAAATENILVERQVLTRAEIDARAARLAERWGRNDSP
jgi:hypothetical protein